jgi:hypothetical protein
LVSDVTGATSQAIVNPTVPSALAGASVSPASTEPTGDTDTLIARSAVEGDNTGISVRSAEGDEPFPGGNTDTATATGGSDEAAPKPPARSDRPQKRAHRDGQSRVQRAGPRG